MSTPVKFFKRHSLWFVFGVFLALALLTHQGDVFFTQDGPNAAGKPIIWLIWLSFLIYSLKVHLRENFFHSLKRMYSILWARQVGLDLYIGLLIPLTIIYLHSGSLVVLLCWFLPILIFANLATLVYLALNYESLVALFLS